MVRVSDLLSRYADTVERLSQGCNTQARVGVRVGVIVSHRGFITRIYHKNYFIYHRIRVGP